MQNMKYKREKKEDLPVLAICYDFDKTLSPDNMQAQGYIQAVYGDDVNRFWEECNKLAYDNDMDSNLAWMFMMKDNAYGKELFTRDKLVEYGSKVKLYEGVDKWFDRTVEIGKQNGVIVEHYIISSGLKEMIEGTLPARNNSFKKIFASSFYFDNKGVAIWPAQVINYTNKTQFLFRIRKGVLDVNDESVNDYFKPYDIRVPFENIVYIGDSETDVPCMRLVNENNGYSIGVYDPITKDKSKVLQMLSEERIKYFAPADYTAGSEIEDLITKIIVRTSANRKLDDIHYNCTNEI